MKAGIATFTSCRNRALTDTPDYTRESNAAEWHVTGLNRLDTHTGLVTKTENYMSRPTRIRHGSTRSEQLWRVS